MSYHEAEQFDLDLFLLRRECSTIVKAVQGKTLTKENARQKIMKLDEKWWHDHPKSELDGDAQYAIALAADMVERIK